jgi:hypothetical protein
MNQAIKLAVELMNKQAGVLESATIDKGEESKNISVKMKCTECGHIQTVKGTQSYGKNYFGSGYDFCDECDGLPEVINDSN